MSRNESNILNIRRKKHKNVGSNDLLSRHCFISSLSNNKKRNPLLPLNKYDTITNLRLVDT